MTLIIGIGNKARHGKDTAAEAIVDYYSDLRDSAKKHGLKVKHPNVTQFRFAEALYEECRTLYGMKEKDGPLLQNVGAARRDEDPEYWIKKVFDQIIPSIDIAVISDVRYKNEATAIKKANGFLINVQRLNEDGSPFIASDRPATHPSETELDGYNWDFYIKAKSLETILVGDQAITIMEYIRSPHG